MALGRPSEYTEQTAQTICAMLADGMSLRTVCLADEMPDKGTVFKWLRDYPEFLNQYTRAKEQSTMAHFEDMFDIADDGSNDWMEVHDKEGNSIGWKENGEAIQRSKLRIETRKWALSKLLPKKYGEKITTEHTGSIDLGAMTDEQINAKIALALSTNATKSG